MLEIKIFFARSSRRNVKSSFVFRFYSLLQYLTEPILEQPYIYILVGPVDMYRITIIDTKKLMSKKTSAFIHYYSRSINILVLVVVALFFRLTCKHKVTYSDFPNTMSLQFLTSNN